LTWWVWVLDERKRYYEFEIARRSGGEARIIRAPIKPIKDLQRCLLPLLAAAYQPRVHVHGFVRERSPVTNASVHRNQRWVLRIDLKDFFPSINFGRIRGLFGAHPFDYPSDVATLLAQICCHRNELPQGAPTSPMLSNLICRRLDRELAAFGNALQCHYTRYADDICFSSGKRIFPSELARLVNDVPVLGPDLRARIDANGFTINESKTRLMPRQQRQRVTGLVVNDRVNVPREYTRHLRAVLHIWAKYGEPDAVAAFERARTRNWPPGKPPPEFRLVVRGQLQYLGAVRRYDRVYQRLANTLTTCDPTFTPSSPATPTRGDVVYAMEGPSDPLHLDAALRSYRSDDEFQELNLRQVSHQPPKNDSQLWAWLQHRKDVPNQIPHVGIFDCDSGYAKQLGAHGWKHLGNGVVAVALAPPPWHVTGDPYCIELLYPREILRRDDANQRRIFLRDEFDESGLSPGGRYQMAHPRSRTLIAGKVHRTGEDSTSVALGKVAFGDAVWRNQAPYETMDFQGFRPTLERVWRAVAAAQQWCS
jgi:RNA-directed DNA polymerase